MNKGSISDWKIVQDKKNLKTKLVNTNKFEDYQRIKDFNLPHFKDYFVDYTNFNKKNKSLMSFLSECNSIIFRAIPKTYGFPRRHIIGKLSFDACRNFLDNLILTNKIPYQIFITKHEPTNKSGIIISKPDKLILEAGNFGLDKLEHGKPPDLSYIIDFYKLGHLEDKQTYLIGGDNKLRKISSKALSYLTLNGDSFNPLYLKGYFEFIVTKNNNEIKFLDYKIDKMYLK